MKSFEVVYYLNLCLPEFVVPKDKVDAALHVPWRREMPVMIAYDTTIARPRKCWHSGRLLNDIDPKNDMINLPDYRWRLLQVYYLFLVRFEFRLTKKNHYPQAASRVGFDIPQPYPLLIVKLINKEVTC